MKQQTINVITYNLLHTVIGKIEMIKKTDILHSALPISHQTC